MPGTKTDALGLEPIHLLSPQRVPGTANTTPLIPGPNAEHRHGPPPVQPCTAAISSTSVDDRTSHTFHLPSSLSTTTCANRSTPGLTGGQWPAAPPGLTRRIVGPVHRKALSALSSPPASDLPAIPCAVQHKASFSTAQPVQTRIRPTLSRRLSRSSNFLDPTTEDDEQEPEDQSQISDDSKPTSASSDADFSVLNQRASMTAGTDTRHLDFSIGVNGQAPPATSSASQSSTSDSAEEVNRRISEQDEPLEAILLRAHEACLHAEVALASSKRALELAMRRLNAGKTTNQDRDTSRGSETTRLKKMPRDKPSLTVLSRSRASTCQSLDSCSPLSSQDTFHQVYKSSLITQASVNESKAASTTSGNMRMPVSDGDRESPLVSFISTQDESSGDQENTSEDDTSSSSSSRRRRSSMHATPTYPKTSAIPQHSRDTCSVHALPTVSPVQPVLGLIEDIAQRPGSNAVLPTSAFSSGSPSETSTDEPFSPIVSDDTGRQLYEHQNKHIRESRSGDFIHSCPSAVEQGPAAVYDLQAPVEDPDAITLAPSNAVAPLSWSKSPDSYDTPCATYECSVDPASKSATQAISDLAVLVDEGQVIPPNLMDATGEYLILEANEKVKIVEIAAPEPQRPLSSHRESFCLRGHVSLERISEEIDYESLAQEGLNRIDSSDVIETLDEVAEAEESKGMVVSKDDAPPKGSIPNASGEVKQQDGNEDDKEILQKSSSSGVAERPPLLPTPTRSTSLDSGSALQAKSAGTDFPQIGETPRSTQVLSSLIGDHLTFLQNQHDSSSAVISANRRSLDSSPSQSAALARRERLIHSLSSSLKVKGVGDAVNDTIQQLEQQAESLHEQNVESTVEDKFENSDLSMNRLVQSHWSSDTSQFDISDSGLGFQLRSDLTGRLDLPGHTPLNQSADGSLLDVSDSGLGVCESAASLFGLRLQCDQQLHHDSIKPADAGEGGYIPISSQSVNVTMPPLAESAAGAKPRSSDMDPQPMCHRLSDKSRSPSTSPSEDTSHNSNPGLLHSRISTDEGKVALLSKSDAGSSTTTTEHDGRSISRARDRSHTKSQSSNHGGSTSLRAKLSKAFFVDRSRGSTRGPEGGTREAVASTGSPASKRKKKLVVNVARANSIKPSDTLAVNSTPDEYPGAPASPSWLGRTIGRAATVGSRKSEPKLTSSPVREEGSVPAACPPSPPNRTIKLSHRLFERARRDSTTKNDASTATAYAHSDTRRQLAVQSPHVEPPGLPRDAMARSPSAPLERRRGQAEFRDSGPDKGKSRAISPDNVQAAVPVRPHLCKAAPFQVQSPDRQTEEHQVPRQDFCQPANAKSIASTVSSVAGAAGALAVSVATKSQDVESNSEGEGLDYHTADGGSTSSVSRRESKALTLTKVDGGRERTLPIKHEGPLAASTRSSMATITLTPKVSISDLSFDSPPPFPNLATSLTSAVGGKEAQGTQQPVKSDEEEEEVTAEMARERARKRFQEWLENQARVRRY